MVEDEKKNVSAIGILEILEGAPEEAILEVRGAAGKDCFPKAEPKVGQAMIVVNHGNVIGGDLHGLTQSLAEFTMQKALLRMVEN